LLDSWVVQSYLFWELLMSQTKSNYNLMWAIAILRDDYRYSWREIAIRMECSMWKARYLHSRVKKTYKIWIK
jgi:hypothetical protein